MYTKGRKEILEIHILVTLVFLIEAEFSCALYDFGEPNDPLFHHDKNTNVIVLLHFMVKRTGKTKHLRA